MAKEDDDNEVMQGEMPERFRDLLLAYLHHHPADAAEAASWIENAPELVGDLMGCLQGDE